MTKYLANENIPMESIRALREEGFDVRSVRELLPGAAELVPYSPAYWSNGGCG
jgi:biotin operon repressor